MNFERFQKKWIRFFGSETRPSKSLDPFRDSKKSEKDLELDLRGLKCPLPVLKTEKRLEQLPAGASLVVVATDPLAKIDIALYCTQRGHDCEIVEVGGALRFTIVKAG